MIMGYKADLEDGDDTHYSPFLGLGRHGVWLELQSAARFWGGASWRMMHRSRKRLSSRIRPRLGICGSVTEYR